MASKACKAKEDPRLRNLRIKTGVLKRYNYINSSQLQHALS